jgi:hypothetical protein
MCLLFVFPIFPFFRRPRVLSLFSAYIFREPFFSRYTYPFFLQALAKLDSISVIKIISQLLGFGAPLLAEWYSFFSNFR